MPGLAMDEIPCAQTGWHRIVKRGFDLALAIPGLLVLGPPLMLLATAIRFSMGSPVLFRQERVGWRGRRIWAIKFRTMTQARDSEGRLLPDAFRLTHLGRFLRQFSLDELPQLLNVIRGDLSLVGPRPLLVAYWPRYSSRQRARHLVKPGITGWAQINGRNAIDWSTRFELDLWYVRHWSFSLDLRILATTAFKVLARSGVNRSAHETMPEFLGDTSEGAGGRGDGTTGR